MSWQSKPPWLLTSSILVKMEAESNPSFGEDPYRRPMEIHLRLGVVCLDKPRGPTSHDVAAKVRQLLGARKAGIGGTLDPLVSGVLPVLLDDATKCAGAVMGGGKEYVCVMKLHGDVSDEEVSQAIKTFTGDIYQIPPVRSSVARSLRVRTIYGMELLERSGRYLLLKVACSGGTYMRKLCYDMGLYLGVGAHMQELRRTRAGPFTEDRSVTLLDLYEAVEAWRERREEEPLRRVVRPVEEAVEHIPKIYILDSAVGAICSGADLAVSGISKLEDSVKRGGTVAIMTLKGELVALGTSRMDSEEIVEAEHGIAVDTERVIMRDGLYPKIWKHRVHRPR